MPSKTKRLTRKSIRVFVLNKRGQIVQRKIVEAKTQRAARGIATKWLNSAGQCQQIKKTKSHAFCSPVEIWRAG